MARKLPVAGQPYQIIAGDTLWGISGICYGDSTKWPRIWRANKNNLRSGDPNLIFPGEWLNIPESETKKFIEEKDLVGKNTNEFTLIMNDLEIPSTAGRVTRSIDTAADGWTANTAWEPGLNPEIDAALLPFGFTKSKVYLGGKLQVTGSCYKIEPEFSTDKIQVNLEGYSQTVDIIDSTMPQPYEARRISLTNRARQITEHMGLYVISDISTDSIFDRVTAKPEDKIFDHLAVLAKQRSALISNTRDGRILITSAKLTGEPVATIEENEIPAEAFSASFDARKIFNTYVAIGQSPRKGKRAGRATDINVPKSRQYTFSANDSTAGNINQVAEYQRNKAYIEALSIQFPVPSWYSDEERRILWDVNTLVFVKSKTLGFADGFIFLIRQVDYLYEVGGNSAVLYLVPPEIYSNKPVKLPWGAK